MTKPQQGVRERKPKPRTGVLGDHKKDGKKLIPPFVAGLGPWTKVSWTDTIIPEVIWIALLQDRFGFQEGVNLTVQLAKAAHASVGKKPGPFFSAISNYASLNPIQRATVLGQLDSAKTLNNCRTALFPLFRFYPTCPLNFMCGEGDAVEQEDALPRLKRVLHELFDKDLRQTVLVQATVIYLAFVIGGLKVVKGLTLSYFPEVEKYPHTELSKRVAATIRSTILNFFSPAVPGAGSNWPVEFWNRGQEIDDCTFNRGKTHAEAKRP